MIWVFDYFLCSSYRYIIYTHSHSNLRHNNLSSTYYVSHLIFDRKNQLDILGRECLMSGKNRLFKSGKTIRLRWDFCRSGISAGFGNRAGFWPEPEPKSGTALVNSIAIKRGDLHGSFSITASLPLEINEALRPGFRDDKRCLASLQRNWTCCC